MGTVANLVVRITAVTSDIDKSLGSMERSLDRMGSRLQSVGTKLSMGLTVPIAAAGVAAVKFASDFEKSTTKLVTLSGVSEAQMQRMRQAVLDMAPAVGIGPRALSEALLVVTSTGFEGAEALKILELSAKSSAIGMGDTKDIARALTAAISAYGAENLTAAQAADILHQTVLVGGAEATELAGELGRVVGVASQLGVSFAEVGAFIATYTRLGLSAAEATTGLSGALNTILSPSQEARKALAGVGLSADSLRTMVAEQGLGGALITLLGRLNGNADAIGAVFGNVRALAGVMGTAGTQAEAYRSNLDKITNSTGSLNAAFERTKTTFAFQWEQLKAQAERAGIALGTVLLPAVQRVMTAAIPLAQALTQWIDWFSRLPQPIQATVIGMVALGAALGPVLYAIGTLLKSGAGLLAFFRMLAGAGGLAGVGTAAGVATAPVLAFTAALAGLVFALPKAIQALSHLWDIWNRFGTKALLGELGRNVNDDRLSFFRDWRVDPNQRRKGVGATPGELAPGALAGGARAAAMRQLMADQAAGFGTAGSDLRLGGIGRGGGGVGELTEEQKRWQKELDRLTGLEAIRAAEEWIKKIDEASRSTRIGTEDLKAYNKALGEAIDAMTRRGDAVPRDLFDRWLRTAQLPIQGGWRWGGAPGQQMPLTNMADVHLGMLPRAVSGFPGGLPGEQLPMPTMPPVPGFFSQAFGSAKDFGAGLASALMQGLTGGGLGRSLGGFFGGGIGSQLGKMASGLGGLLGGALGSVIPGLGTMLGSLAGGLFGKLFGPTEYEKRVRAEAAERREIVSGADMATLQSQAAMTGRGDLLQQFLAVQQSAAPEYLRGLLTDLNSQHQQLQAAMDRYGISWEQLGEKAKQSQINQMAEQFITDFQVLTQAGADVNFIIEKMSGSVNEFIQTALRTGTEVPIAMKPMLDKMLEMGLLTDASGAKLESLGGITFSESLTQGIDRIVTAIQHLAKALGYDIPNAVATANGALAGLQAPALVASGGGDGVEPVNVPALARGGFVKASPGGSLVRVGEGGQDELILPVNSLMNQGSGGGGVAQIYLDSELVAEAVVPRIPGVVQRYGLA